MTDAEKLLPCPFCGGVPQTQIRRVGPDVYGHEDYIGVRCHMHTDWITIEQWNRRAPSAHIPEDDEAYTRPEQSRDIYDLSTPRTDELAHKLWGKWAVPGEIESFDLARQLEAELSDAHGIIAEQTRIANEEMDKHKAKLSACRAAAMEEAAGIVGSYRWDELHNECCEANMGWLISQLETAIRAKAKETK